MHVVPAALDDARAIAEIQVAAWRAAYASIVPDDFLAALSIDARESTWRASLSTGAPETLVARLDGRVVGWLAFDGSRDEDATASRGELWAVYVAPDRWSSGVGRALWERARTRLRERGFDACVVWVLADNARAIRFYRAAGFAPDGATKEIAIGGRGLTEARFAISLAGDSRAVARPSS